MKTCLGCKTTQSHRWHKGPKCTDCYNKDNIQTCIQCDKQKSSSRWYSGPICPNCYNKKAREKSLRAHTCIKCGVGRSTAWYSGPRCRNCWTAEYRLCKKSGNFVAKDTSIFKEQSVRGRYLSAIQRTKKRKKNIKWDLEYSDYPAFVKQNCYYCDTSLLNEVGTGLDRINNDGGYSKDNVLACCGGCNRSRGDRFSVEDFKFMMDSLVSKRNNDINTKVLRNDRILPVDVDRTLILYDNIYEPSQDKVEIEYGGRSLYFKPSKAHIDLLKHHYERGYHIRVWSANGFTWAEKVVNALGLNNFVHSIESKFKEYVDDKPVSEWAKCRIFLEEE